MYRNKKVGIIGIVITIAVLIILVILTSTGINKFSKAEGFFGKLVMPLQNGLTRLKNRVSGNNAFFEDINKLKEENEKLADENKKLKEDLRELEIIKTENATLRAYNNMSSQYSEYTTIPGDIIAKDISNLSDTMVINIGSDDGVAPNMPVVTSEGLVGYVLSVTNKTAKVQPIIDVSSNIGARISTSRESVVARGILRK